MSFVLIYKGMYFIVEAHVNSHQKSEMAIIEILYLLEGACAICTATHLSAAACRTKREWRFWMTI